MWTWSFWKDAIERAIRTAAQTTAAIIGTNQTGITSLNWPDITAVAATASVLSILTSIGASGATGSPNAAFVEIKGDK